MKKKVYIKKFFHTSCIITTLEELVIVVDGDNKSMNLQSFRR